MPGHDIIVVGASAGGVQALVNLVPLLPQDLPAALFVVVHFPATATSVLPHLLERAGPLPAAHAQDGEPIQHGRIYVAPPDYHLLLKRGTVHLSRGPHENGHRPAIDVLFRSAALAYGPQVVGVVLSGTLDDGTAGLRAIKSRRGVAIVQDPAEALYGDMPRNALELVAVDHSLPLAGIAAALTRLAQEPVTEEGNGLSLERLQFDVAIADFNLDAIENEGRPGQPSPFACPECGGVLWERDDGELLTFRCRVGHAYSPDTLLAHQTKALETALWTALRALEERASLLKRMIQRFHERDTPQLAVRFEQQYREAEQQAALLRHLLLHDHSAALLAQVVQNLVSADNQGPPAGSVPAQRPSRASGLHE
jgi:two-component system chemotaxis response regulator CheB